MAATSASERSVSPIVVPGQLTLRTIRGKNGPFTVGRLATHLGTFEVKDPELEQYPEGKYDGEFIIRYIFPKSYPVGGGMRFEIRASLDGMTLYDIDKLSRDEARSFATQDLDPLDEELGAQPAVTPATPAKPTKPIESSWMPPINVITTMSEGYPDTSDPRTNVLATIRAPYMVLPKAVSRPRKVTQRSGDTEKDVSPSIARRMSPMKFHLLSPAARGSRSNDMTFVGKPIQANSPFM